MVSGLTSERTYLSDTVTHAVKILVVGPFAVGKTTFVDTVSEIRPLRTEETMTEAAAHVDDLSGVQGKTTTTVALDFGRLTLSERLVLYLFGTPGQQRFAQLWTDLASGALGALVLVDPARLEKSFEVMDRLEDLRLPYAVAVNHFDDGPRHPLADLRDALDLPDPTPLVECDARERSSSVNALISLVDHLLLATA